MNNYKVFIGVDVSKDYFTTTVLFDDRKETFKVVSKAEEFEKRIKPYIRVLDKSEALILMEHRAISMILSILRGFEGFDNAKNVGSYLGICPSPVESGTSVQGRGGIRKRGSSYARKVLYLCGLSAIRANRYCRELYERLVKKGKAKKLAIVAAGHKLIRQAFGVLKSGQLFQANLCFNCLT